MLGLFLVTTVLLNCICQSSTKTSFFNKTEMTHRQTRTIFGTMLGFLWLANLFGRISAHTPYGIFHYPWSYYHKSIYPTYEPYISKSSWYPIPEPYAYSQIVHPTFFPDFQHKDHDRILHVHDSDSHVDNYKGHDYHNSITNVEYHDLAEVASNLNVRKVKQKPNKPNKKSEKVIERRSDSTSRRNNSMKRRQMYTNKSRNMSRRRIPARYQSRRRPRPTRKTYSNYYYDDRDFYNNRRKHHNYDDDFEYGDYENFQRQQDYYQDTSEPSLSTQTVTDTEVPTSTAVPEPPTVSTTSKPAMETTQNNNGNVSSTPTTTLQYDFGAYGPSNGHENISITYGPPLAVKNDFDFGNFWYSNLGAPNIFNYKDYLQGGSIQ